MTKIQSILLAAALSLAGTVSLYADGLDDLAAQIKADHAYVLSHPQTIDPEALRLQHDAQMSADMKRLDEEIAADHAAYNEHLAKWVTALQDQDTAKRLAEAKAAQDQIDKQRSQLHTWVTAYGPVGTTSVRYDGTGQATDKIDTYYGQNREVTTYKTLEN